MQYDVQIDVFDDTLLEAIQPSKFTGDVRGRVVGKDYSMTSKEIYTPAIHYDPDASYALGPQIRSGLSLGSGYYVEVADFGAAVVVKVTYTQISTSKGASMTFLVTFNSKNGGGTVYANAKRHRSVSDYSQAISYIRSYATTLPGRVSGYS